MQRLYDSEINASIASFWNGGFDVKLGDQMNGFVATARLQTWDEVERWLAAEAIRHYPGSEFARSAR
jgi:hypothetical protein